MKRVIRLVFKLEGIKFREIEIISKDNKEYNDIKVKVEADAFTFTKLETLKGQTFPGYDKQILDIRFILSSDLHTEINTHPKEGEEITYPYEYNRMVKTDFERSIGEEGLIFKNKEIIDKQRAVLGYLVKKVGMSLLKGKSLMSISLPINIFDVRSHLEV